MITLIIDIQFLNEWMNEWMNGKYQRNALKRENEKIEWK